MTRIWHGFAILFLATGCAVNVAERDAGPEPGAIVWPSPPEPGRIRYEMTFSSPEDLGIRASLFKRAWASVTGEDERGMLRPYAIAAHDRKILVADPGRHVVHLFDRKRKSHLEIDTAENLPLESPVGAALGTDRAFVADSVHQKVFVFSFRGEFLFALSDFQRPTGLAYDYDLNRLYVADTQAHSVHVFDEKGDYLFDFGSRGIDPGRLNFPTHIAISSEGLWVTDSMNFRMQLFSREGEFLGSFGSQGNGSGYFSQPKGVASDSDGNVYVAGSTIDRIQIFSPGGDFLLSFGETGSGLGQFLLPAGLAINENLIYVADSFNHRIQVFRYLPIE